MSDDTSACQLIVRQEPPFKPGLELLLETLHNDHGLDAYTARHRLVGPGKALFGQGAEEQTTLLARVLREHGVTCWVVRRSSQVVAPVRLRELTIAADNVVFTCHGKTILLPRGAAVVAVLADISGQLEEHVLRRHVVQRRYKDARQVTAMAEEEMVEAVLKGKAVLDLYVLAPGGGPPGALRILPARFNARGLGERMTMSAVRNLEAVIQLAREYAGRFVLHADFGLGRIPGCLVKSLDGQLLAEEKVLASLTRYGGLMCDLLQDQDADGPDPAMPAAVAALLGQPALAAMAELSAAGESTVLNEHSKELGDAARRFADQSQEDSVSQWLPSPPERPESRASLRVVSTVLGAFVLGVLLVMLSGNEVRPLLRAIGTYGVKAGVVPALLSLGLLWGGFHFVRLKRKIENTPTSRVRSLAMGFVEIHGRARRKYALVSPLSQSACIYYRLRKYRRDRRDQWQLASDTDSRHVPFLLEDDTGRVIVDPAGAAVRPQTSRTGVPGEDMLAFNGVSLGDQDEKWVEDIIYEGTTLYVLGFASPLREERRGLRQRTLEKLRDLKLDRRAMHRYDADGDGRISEGEWQVARDDAEQTALREHLSEGSARGGQEARAVIGRAPQRWLPFLVAEVVSEAKLVRKYWLLSLLLFAAAVAVAGLALYHFLRVFGV